MIDCFLFFQELDLLEIRLKYLNNHVDYFVIVESCQTFSGAEKDYVFEKNRERFEEYKNKIIYHKVEDFHLTFGSVIKHLETQSSNVSKKISKILLKHEHYNKKELNWVLDAYHRECIHFALEGFADDDDIVIVSDLDEIPNIKILTQEMINQYDDKSFACAQKEFRYYLNYYKDDQWVGSIIGKWRNVKNYSLNSLRIDSKSSRNFVSKKLIEDGGYHFTSCGSKDEIANKIKCWSHQEFNRPDILEKLEQNLLTGQDIFLRSTGTNLARVKPEDKKYYDTQIIEIIKNYPKLIGPDLEETKPSVFKTLFYKIINYAHKKNRLVNSK